MKPPPITFSITLEALPGWPDIPAIVRLRNALKELQRRHGLRCVEVAEATETNSVAETTGGERVPERQQVASECDGAKVAGGSFQPVERVSRPHREQQVVR